jgi:dienelactone hydrolase
MSFTSECCNTPPVESNYSPKGTDTQFEDFTIYETGELKKNGRLLICVYDIFGFHLVTKQVCDKLASCGYRVVMPDFFRGKPISQENFPPKE